MPPAPLPTSTPAARLAEPQAGILPRFARGDDGDQRRFRVAPRVGPTGAIAARLRRPFHDHHRVVDRDRGTGAATVHGNGDASKSVIARVALQPRLTWRQNRSRPTPYGDTTPMPVIATRASGRRHVPIICCEFHAHRRRRPIRPGPSASPGRRRRLPRSRCCGPPTPTCSASIARRVLAHGRCAGYVGCRAVFALCPAPQPARAVRRQATGRASWRRRQLERSLYTWAASLLFIVVCALWQPVPGTLYRARRRVARAVAYAVQLAGLVLTIRSSAALDVLDLAGVRSGAARARRHMPPRTCRSRPRGALRLRAASALLRLGPDGVRHARHDRHPR